MHVIFWTALIILGYTFCGYAALMWLLAKYRHSENHQETFPKSQPSESISILIAAHNEADHIKQRIRNLLDSDFIDEQWEIIIVSDGSNDGTAKIAQQIKHPQLKVIEMVHRQGKAACINIAADAAKSEILIFTDARQSFASDTITELTRPFADPDVVGVGGKLHIASSQQGALSGLNNYWRLECKLRSNESRFWSTVGCSGAIYAIRAKSFKAIPEDTILDDIVIPMQATRGGGRMLFRQSARAFDPHPLNSGRERSRKIRTLSGNFQMLFRYHKWLCPWGHPQWWQLISHKYLRILAPAFLVLCAISNTVLLSSHSLYVALGSIQAATYSIALLGLYTPLSRFRPFSIAASFLFLNAMVIGGLFCFLVPRKQRGWQ